MLERQRRYKSPDQANPTRRQRRIARRRREIMDAAARVFAEQGYPNTTTRAIAEAADMAEGTLYNYFGSKRDILLAIFQQLQSEADALLDTIARPEDNEDLVTIVERGFDLVLTRLPFVRILWAEVWTDDEVLREFGIARVTTLYSRIRAFIVARMASGHFRTVDPDLATKMALGLFLAPLLPVMRGTVTPPPPEELRAMAQAAVDLVLRGLEIARPHLDDAGTNHRDAGDPGCAGERVVP
ncbi:MAG: TetR/AcrR family transcriptional regulator [Anaerolineae bacterium]|nr:TetR/AcrR family transcriptional regulator [Anaerolineae bacterium]